MDKHFNCNGRTARLIEKWFLLDKIGVEATAVELEKNYFVNRPLYYANLKKLGLEYDSLKYENALDFVMMTVSSLK